MGRGFSKGNSADAVSSAPGRFALGGSTGRYPDALAAEGCATFFRTHVENVLHLEDEHRAQNNVLSSGVSSRRPRSATSATRRRALLTRRGCSRLSVLSCTYDMIILKRFLLPIFHDHNTVLLSVRYVLLWHSARCSAAPEARGGSNSLAKVLVTILSQVEIFSFE